MTPPLLPAEDVHNILEYLPSTEKIPDNLLSQHARRRHDFVASDPAHDRAAYISFSADDAELDAVNHALGYIPGAADLEERTARGYETLYTADDEAVYAHAKVVGEEDGAQAVGGKQGMRVVFRSDKHGDPSWKLFDVRCMPFPSDARDTPESAVEAFEAPPPVLHAQAQAAGASPNPASNLAIPNGAAPHNESDSDDAAYWDAYGKRDSDVDLGAGASHLASSSTMHANTTEHHDEDAYWARYGAAEPSPARPPPPALPPHPDSNDSSPSPDFSLETVPHVAGETAPTGETDPHRPRGVFRLRADPRSESRTRPPRAAELEERLNEVAQDRREPTPPPPVPAYHALVPASVSPPRPSLHPAAHQFVPSPPRGYLPPNGEPPHKSPTPAHDAEHLGADEHGFTYYRVPTKKVPQVAGRTALAVPIPPIEAHQDQEAMQASPLQLPPHLEHHIRSPTSASHPMQDMRNMSRSPDADPSRSNGAHRITTTTTTHSMQHPGYSYEEQERQRRAEEAERARMQEGERARQEQLEREARARADTEAREAQRRVVRTTTTTTTTAHHAIPYSQPPYPPPQNQEARREWESPASHPESHTYAQPREPSVDSYRNTQPPGHPAEPRYADDGRGVPGERDSQWTGPPSGVEDSHVERPRSPPLPQPPLPPPDPGHDYSGMHMRPQDQQYGPPNQQPPYGPGATQVTHTQVHSWHDGQQPQTPQMRRPPSPPYAPETTQVTHTQVHTWHDGQQPRSPQQDPQFGPPNELAPPLESLPHTFPQAHPPYDGREDTQGHARETSQQENGERRQHRSHGDSAFRFSRTGQAPRPQAIRDPSQDRGVLGEGPTMTGATNLPTDTHVPIVTPFGGPRASPPRSRSPSPGRRGGLPSHVVEDSALWHGVESGPTAPRPRTTSLPSSGLAHEVGVDPNAMPASENYEPTHEPSYGMEPAPTHVRHNQEDFVVPQTDPPPSSNYGHDPTQEHGPNIASQHPLPLSPRDPEYGSVGNGGALSHSYTTTHETVIHTRHEPGDLADGQRLHREDEAHHARVPPLSQVRHADASHYFVPALADCDYHQRQMPATSTDAPSNGRISDTLATQDPTTAAATTGFPKVSPTSHLTAHEVEQRAYTVDGALRCIISGAFKLWVNSRNLLIEKKQRDEDKNLFMNMVREVTSKTDEVQATKEDRKDFVSVVQNVLDKS